MPIDRGEVIELSTEDLLGIYPFFGRKSLCIDSLKVQKTPSGEVGTKAIGTWVIPEGVTDEHFNDFEVKGGRKVINLKLIPGHYWAEALGQALGGLVYLKYLNRAMEILPIFGEAGNRYKEAAFLGDKVNLCVELTGEPEEERGRFRLRGRGAAIFNERTLAIVDPITVNIMPLGVGARALESLRSKHQSEIWTPASFDNFPQYYTQI